MAGCFLSATPARALDAAYRDQLIQVARDKHLSAAPAWRHLLHWRRNILGVQGSGIDDPHFFLAPDGARHPEAELEATLAAFLDPAPAEGSDTQTHAQCRYPARYAWLKRELAFDPQRMPEVVCGRFETWRARLNADSVTLVFASYYMNNPSSMYGHTFLRLNRPADDPTTAHHLLDYTVNFAATTTTDNGALYALYGLAGLFRGRFSTMPYYVKVQEYSNLESRDLWEYPLHLTPAQVDLLVRHLWELGQTSMAYYFFNRNCSYQLLPLLEAAAPDLRLSGPFRFKTIPVDTLRAILSWPGLSDPGALRPSYRSTLLERRALLKPDEVRQVERLADQSLDVERSELRGRPAERQALILDSARDLLRYRAGFAPDQPAVEAREQVLLRARSTLDVSSVTLPVPRDSLVPPDRGHASGRVTFNEGLSNRSAFQEIGLRPALQDLDDPAAGYLSGSRLEMFNTRLRWDDRRSTLYIEELSLVNIVSLPDWDRWIKKPSWKINAGARVAHELNRDPENSLYFGLNFGPGWSARAPGPLPLRVFVFADVDSGAGAAWNAGGRFGAGGSGGLMMDFSPACRLRFEMQHIHYVIGDPDSTTHLSVVPSWSVTHSVDLRLNFERWNKYKEARFGVYWFL